MEPILGDQIIYCLSPIFPCEIYFYEVKTKTCKCKILPITRTVKGKVYEPRIPASCVMVANTCLVCGGGHPDLPEYFNQTVLCHVNPVGDWDFKILQVQNMLMEKAEHSLCAISDDLVLSVGGVYSKGLLNFCEAYSLSKNVWIQYGSLTVPRKQASLCLFAGSIVYAFGGKNAKDLPITSIEKLKLGNPKSSWRTAILISDKTFSPLAAALAVDIGDDTIFIAGGTTYSLDPKMGKPVGGTLVELQESKKTLYFNTKTLQFTPGPDLQYPTSFSVGPPVFSKAKGIVGAIDIQMSIHLYSMTKKEWMCIREAKWNAFKFQIKASSELNAFLQ